ncbi:hypothetical protein E2C01_027767 [Portunus trituberculatus]|uniref:Uncharacterized protein n=1 Tax=Portunus trituberculatus TaxID=210409 RepID=A0A5B7EIQ4_PORTR|nr:hypothetical protein [Portunus trituberculatus]
MNLHTRPSPPPHFSSRFNDDPDHSNHHHGQQAAAYLFTIFGFFVHTKSGFSSHLYFSLLSLPLCCSLSSIKHSSSRSGARVDRSVLCRASGISVP